MRIFASIRILRIRIYLLFMQTNPYCGLCIAVDGIDGSSKTTQAKRIVKYLQNIGVHAVYTKEPWWGQMTEGDHRLRRAITQLDDKEHRAKLEQIQKLFIDNRGRHLIWEVIPLLGQASPTVVVMDRYAFSTMAYGAATTLYSFEEIYQMHSDLKWFFLPDVSFILDLNPEIAVSRLKKSPDIFEERKILEAVREEYKKMVIFFKNEGVYLIDGSGTEEEVFERMAPAIDRVLTEKFRR